MSQTSYLNQEAEVADELEFETYHVLPQGLYNAELKEITGKEFEFGPCYQFRWRVLDGENVGAVISGLANKRLTPKSKLSKWSKAHLGIAAFSPGFKLKLSDMIGKRVAIMLDVEPRRDGQGDRNAITAITAVTGNGTSGGNGGSASKAPPPAAGGDQSWTDAMDAKEE